MLLVGAVTMILQIKLSFLILKIFILKKTQMWYINFILKKLDVFIKIINIIFDFLILNSIIKVFIKSEYIINSLFKKSIFKKNINYFKK